jgi:peptidoglycan/LPS O-acetylase OafA/YrhL
MILKYGHRAILIAILLLGVLIQMEAHYSETFLNCAMYFYSGCMVFWIYNSYKEYKKTICISSFLGIAIWGLTGYLFPYFKFEILDFPLSSLLFSSLVMVTVMLDYIDKGKIGAKLECLGKLSYSIYLWHVPVQIVILIAANYFSLSRDIFFNNTFFISFILIVLIISFYSQKYIEFPLRQLIRNRNFPKLKG